ncbi:MAG: GNAT family N-acetyltransferase [Chloroflexota bacterium]
MPTVTYKEGLDSVDWAEMKATLLQDNFDNGRSPKQLKASFENSYATCIAYAEGNIIGTVRALSDGVCNAYIVDVWTLSAYRHQGIASKMIQTVLDKLSGQHVYLFTNDAVEFYKKLGFKEQDIGLGKVVGKWLVN